MNDLPAGYYWATEAETEAHAMTPNPDMIVVPRTADADGVPYTEGEADLALPVPLPRNRDGEIETSALYGECWMVHIQYNTDFDGTPIDPEHQEWPETFHGPFHSQQEAADWCNAYPDGDTDIHDMYVKCMNRVRPSGLPAITAKTVAYTDGERAARADLGLSA